MMDFIAIPTVVGICVYGTYKLFELFAHRRERILLIEKLHDTSISGSQTLKLPDFYSSSFSSGALKGGCLLIGIGLGLLIGFIICYSSIPDYIQNTRSGNIREVTSLVYGASVLLFGGAGLIVAFLIEQKIGRDKENKLK